MRYIANRIVVSLVAIVALAYFWEFWVRPKTSPLYTEAVAQYRNKNYARSLELLQAAYRIDANDTAILTLLGWDYLKMNKPEQAEPYFERAHRLAPDVVDTLTGYAYTEIGLKKYEQAASLLQVLKRQGDNSAAVHMAWATLYREVGRNQAAAHEFQIALALDRNNLVALKNLREIYDVSGDVQEVRLTLAPLERSSQLTYPARVVGEHFEWEQNGAWKPVYLKGMDLIAALPGEFPTTSATDPDLYRQWFQKMTDMGVNTVRVYNIMSPGFYRALFGYNTESGHPPLRLLQGMAFGDPPRDDMFNHEFYATCQQEIRDVIDVVHGQGDVGATHTHPGGIYPNSVAPWVAGFVMGTPWVSHAVTGNNQLHSDLTSFQGTFIQVPSGNATEVFFGQMVNYAAEYELSKYNWQHPLAFANWPTLDPLRHPTESTILEEVSIRRGVGERVPDPEPPYDDDDSVTVDPLSLHPTPRLVAGYFAAYSVFPSYPDFMNDDPAYLAVKDAQGSDPFLGYLKDLKAHQRGVPLVITGYGVPSSLGVGHFSPAGLDQGGETARRQGELLARLTRNVYDAGAAGGMVFEWLDEWFRQTWLVRNFETPQARKPLWTNLMDPAEHYGVVAADPHGRARHLLDGAPAAFQNEPPFYPKVMSKMAAPVGDRYDPARDLKALYADADEGYLYLRLVVSKLDNDGDGQPDWKQVNYLIGVSTVPNQAGLAYLPFIAPVRFPMGMTYAIQLAGPELSRLWIASSYNPYHVAPVEGIPAQTVLSPKLGWKPQVTDLGAFEPQIIEPNRRRFGRDGKYFPPQRYDRGILRYGVLDPASPDYDSLAEWHASVQTNTIDLRIPWNLLNVTDPSSFKVFAGLERDGTVDTAETPGFLFAVFSYRPLESARKRPLMEQGQPIADALPGMTGPATMLATAYKYYRWKGWEKPSYDLRIKDSYDILAKAFHALPDTPPMGEQPQQPVARVSGHGRERVGSNERAHPER